MTPVQRFDSDEDLVDLVPDESGEWIRYEEHVKAIEEARAEATEAAFTEMRRRWDEAFGVKE